MFTTPNYSPNEIADATTVFNTIFNNLPQDESPWLGTQYHSYSFQTLTSPDSKRNHSNNGLYYGISTVDGATTATSSNSLARSNSNIKSLRAIVLDDIGTKVDPTLIHLQPTFKIESSLNNFQYVYVLSEPITDRILATRLLNSFKAHKPILGDLACFTIGRIARLPLGINGKEDTNGITNTFRPKLHTDPLREQVEPTTYSYLEVLSGLGVSLQQTQQPTPDPQLINSSPATTRKPLDDDLYVWLQQNGYVNPEQPDSFEGYARVMCPRHDEHSNGSMYDAGFSPEDVTQKGRQFKCHHSHDGKPPNTKDFLRHYAQLGAPIETQLGKQFELSETGKLKPHFRNACLVLDTFEETIRLNSLSERTFVGNEELSDVVLNRLRIKAFDKFDCVNFNSKEMRDAVVTNAERNSYNPVQDYFNDLPEHDGVKRAETIFIDNLQVDNTALTRLLTRKWLLAIITRVFQPGCEFDHALFLTGNEGTGKTSMFTALAIKPEWRAEVTSTKTDKVEEAIKGTIIAELAEGIVLKNSKAEEVKHMISTRFFNQRLAYQEFAKQYDVSAVWCGTSNKTDFIDGDHHGLRRYWALQVRRPANDVYDYEQFISDIPQIYAEVKTWHAAGEALKIPKAVEAELVTMRENIVEEDAWQQDIINYLDGNVEPNKISSDLGRLERVCIKMLCQGALEADEVFKRGTADVKRLNAIMARLSNWEKKKMSMKMPQMGNAPQKGWVRINDKKCSRGINALER